MRLTNQNYFQKSDDELRFILRDASAAAQAVGTFDRRAEDKYLEQIDDAATVLAQRARSRRANGYGNPWENSSPVGRAS